MDFRQCLTCIPKRAGGIRRIRVDSCAVDKAHGEFGLDSQEGKPIYHRTGPSRLHNRPQSYHGATLNGVLSFTRILVGFTGAVLPAPTACRGGRTITVDRNLSTMSRKAEFVGSSGGIFG